MFIDEQHGFISSRSTCTNLVTYHNELVNAVDAGTQITAVYMDFSKAFDKVCHRSLIMKLESCGIFGSLLEWFKSYLSNRTQYVVVKGFESKTYTVTSGVPQGSHLGPWLFNIFINDIVSYIKHSSAYLFADDLKICKTIKDSADCNLLQSDLDALTERCTSNKMTFNTDKFYYITFTRNHSLIETPYHINNIVLQKKTEIRDLGVILDSKLTFLPHIDNIINKSSKMSGFISRNTKSFRKPATKIALYNSYVPSNLEYCSVVWSPQYNVHQLRIERIQRRFLRHLSFSFGLQKQLKCMLKCCAFKLIRT